MKGITHFIIGIAGATFIKRVINLTIDDNSLILLIAGVYGILPDTIDFKFAKFFEKFDKEIELEPDNPEKMAKIIANSINESKSKPIKIKLHTLPIGIGLWQQYEVKFNTDEIVVRVGHKVSTSQTITHYVNTPKEGRAKFSAKILPDVYESVIIDIFDGPAFKFEPIKDKVVITFLYWHRKWSHSFLSSILFSLLALPFGIIYFLVSLIAYNLHIFIDMLGMMGTNLFFPFTKFRIPGVGLFHSANSFANFGFILLSISLILNNINRYFYNITFSLPIYILIFGVPILLIIIGALGKKLPSAIEKIEETKEHE